MSKKDLVSMEVARYLQGKNVLVIGSNPGKVGNIGSAVAEMAMINGAGGVWVTGTRIEGPCKYADLLNSRGYAGVAYGRAVNILEVESVKTVMEEMVERGGVDIVINCAATFSLGRLKDISIEQLLRDLHVDIDGAWILAKLALDYMKAGSHLVFASSIADNDAFVGTGPYPATKAAVSMTARLVGFELGQEGILVTVVKPGFVKTKAFEETVPNCPEGSDAKELMRRIIQKFPASMSTEASAWYLWQGVAEQKKVVTYPFSSQIAAFMCWIAPEFIDSKSTFVYDECDNYAKELGVE